MALLCQVVGCKDLPAPANTSEGSGVDGKNWFPLSTLGFSFSRDISMEVGKTANTDAGTTNMSEACFTKASDPSSEIILSLLFSPGDEGHKFEFVSTKANRIGEGFDVAQKITLTNCRITSVSYDFNDSGSSVEVVSLVYTTFEIKYYHETSEGKMAAGGTVGVDCKTGKATSKAC
ncbi:type VI secretion system tube protein Hcp [uncultured Shewanella sp.]|uniref:type VI secretion system tube protein Hcp n=1 Tax=uncultured Shewanella sp. TaxID=173975 RepID=UPI002622AF92|nr:type VI secretion system tube protein Hcp [uncultured Shewanella sp.]